MTETAFLSEYMQMPAPLEVHVAFPLTQEQYNRMGVQNPGIWRRCLFSPARGTGYLLDPDNDARDRVLMDHYSMRTGI